MAGIDKMHWTIEQKIKFYDWYFEHYNINAEGIDMLDSIYEHDYGTTVDDIRATTNFDKKTDAYLKKHCKLDFVQKRLKEQYG